METSNISNEMVESPYMPNLWEPYRDPRVIRSAGRTALPTAFSHYMALKSGISPAEIASAFDESGDISDRESIEQEIRFLTGVFVDGRIRTFARLMGGGNPTELTSSVWEIDDPIPRFAKGSLNIERPHDLSAQDTHWIFVDNEEWDAAMDGLRDQLLEPHEVSPTMVVNLNAENTVDRPALEERQAAADIAENEVHERSSPPWRNEILTLDGVMKATGLKKSTIYAKINEGSFPRQIVLHGSRRGWRRGEIQNWLEQLSTKK